MDGCKPLLSVHKGCSICFDSEEVPDYTDFGDENELPLDGMSIDLSSMRGRAAIALHFCPIGRFVEM